MFGGASTFGQNTRKFSRKGVNQTGCKAFVLAVVCIPNIASVLNSRSKPVYFTFNTRDN